MKLNELIQSEISKKMKELKDIVVAYDQAVKEGKQTALATVVHVVGSSYRRPGARMLVREDGKLTGAISGGCLEGDALRKAQMVMVQQHPILVLYDTTDDDDAKLGIGLGCNGLIHILIEPISTEKQNNPIELIKQFLGKRQTAVLVTLFSLNNRKGTQPGTQLLINEAGAFKNQFLANDIEATLISDAKKVLQEEDSNFNTYETKAALTAFFEYLKPPVTIVIAGAGNDAKPIAEMCKVLGWQVMIVDGRPNYATPERFPGVEKLIVAKPHQVLSNIDIDEQTVFILMTHNYNYDLELLKILMPLDVPYIGSLGPKKKLDRMLEELQQEGTIFTEEQLQKVYGPTGLDIGAEGSEEIALSILAEVKAVLAKRNGAPLRERNLSIHSNHPIT